MSRRSIMAEPGFQVVFDGQLVAGADLAEVRARIAKLFKMQPDQVEPLFSGKPVVVKRGLDADTAERYRLAFEQAGAVATIVDPEGEAEPAASTTPSETPQAEPAAPAPSPDAEGEDAEPSRLAAADAGRAPPPMAARGLPSAPDDMTMAEAGAVLVEEHRPVEAPQFDTSHLTLAEPGVDLVEPGEREQVSAPEFDLSAYELAPPGAVLTGGP